MFDFNSQTHFLAIAELATTAPPARSPEALSRDEAPQDSSKLAGRRSRSPTPSIGAATVDLALNHTEKGGPGSRRPTFSRIAPPRKPVVTQSGSPAIPSERCSTDDQRATTSAVSGHTKSCQSCAHTLLPELAQPINPLLAGNDRSITLQELAHVVRLAKYQERKRVNTRICLQKSLICTALSARLTRCGDTAHRNLVESFRKDDKDGFARLYNAIQDVRQSCDELRRYALLEPDGESLPTLAFGSSESLGASTSAAMGHATLGALSPFLHDISSSARDTFMEFLGRLRNDPDYVATRICALSSSELDSFQSFHKGMEPVESVLPFHGRSASRNAATTSSRSSSAPDVQRLMSFQRHDPLSILIHSCFANSAGPDSSEDRRRTDVWATVLARLIQRPGSSSEQFLISVLNIWTTARDWAGKANMEWYLMKILQEGAFILERAEDQHGTRFNLTGWSSCDELAARDFYERAVEGLFEIVDDEDATGIPDGLLELGNAILQKLDAHYVENTSRWLVWRCLFFVFLLGVVVHPESYGMLADFHITPYAREKILKKVAMKAHEYVSSIWSGKPSATCAPVAVPTRIAEHVKCILARFQSSRTKAPTTKLLPARSIMSLQETAEVHPYLLLSPSDLVTLVNALHPERRPTSSMSNKLRPGSASLSAVSTSSQHVPSPANMTSVNMETASVISTVVSTPESDATSVARDGIKQDCANAATRSQSPLTGNTGFEGRQDHHEDDGYRLRLAVHEMRQILGPDAVRGHRHPCAERWAVLFVSHDGASLTTTMAYDSEDVTDETDDSSCTDTDEDEMEGLEMDKDYHQLRDAILRLVEEYEVPRGLNKLGYHDRLTNRASRLKRFKSKKKLTVAETSTSSPDPFRQYAGAQNPARSPEHVGPLEQLQHSEDEDHEPLLIQMLKAAASQSKAQADFVSAHVYWKTCEKLQTLEPPSLRRNCFEVLINIFSRGPRDSLRRSAAAIEEYDAWLVWLKQSQERHEGLVDGMMMRVRAIRDKMWFAADVRHSKEYVHTRDICHALKTMGMPQRSKSLRQSGICANRASGPSFLRRTESQIMDLLAASEEQGGPNKLSDDQAEATSMWLRQHGVENFCQGEERIHRFCYEVDKCLSGLVGENIRDAPVLWSSDLYKREKTMYDRVKARNKDQAWHANDVAGISSENELRFGNLSTTLPRPGQEVRNPGTASMTQYGSDYIRTKLSRPATSLPDQMEGSEVSERMSLASIAELHGTFWSPFTSATSSGSAASRTYSPNTSLTSLSATFSCPPFQTPLHSTSSVSTGRPETSASASKTVFQQRSEDEKTHFLAELRQTLISLLLSDVGSQLLSRGSETDAWFGDLGQQCIERRDALDRRARSTHDQRDGRPGVRSGPRPRVIEKKKSFRNLREEPKQRDGFLDFPFNKAYHRLLNTVSVHPNPLAKLSALNELQKLIVASLRWKGSRKPGASQSPAGCYAPGDRQSRRTTFSDATDNAHGRQTHVPRSSLAGDADQLRQMDREALPPVPNEVAGIDVITTELQRLLRDATIRPRSLYRDLQLIAAFVPPSVLDGPGRGKAFWNVGVAALRLKSEVCSTMVEMADEVMATHTRARNIAEGITSLPQAEPSPTGTPPLPSTRYSLSDAGKMWAIAAKEGNHTAQRELALFYLSNPEIVERTTPPLSKPREVFKQAVMDKYGRSEKSRLASAAAGPAGPASAAMASRTSAGVASPPKSAANGNEGHVRNDADLICVAVHWMEAAALGGDELATSFLRQNEFGAPL